MLKSLTATAILGVSLMLAAPAAEAHDRTSGTIVGVGAGAVSGAAIGGPVGALVGAVVGGVTGKHIGTKLERGYYGDRRYYDRPRRGHRRGYR